MTLASLDPTAVPLPNGTEVSTRVDRVVGDRIVPQGAIGRVLSTDGEHVIVRVVGVGPVPYVRGELMPRKLGQARYAERRAASWDALGSSVVLQATVGSRAWGLADEGSDHDVRGVFALPLSWSSGLQPGPDDLVSLDASTTYWELRKAVAQGIRADPNTLEMLFVPTARALDPIGEWLMEARDAFVSAEIYGAFGRYAISQLDKLSQSMRLAEHRTIVLAWLREDPDLTLDATAQKLADAVITDAPTRADAVLRAKQYIKQLYRSLHDQGLVAAREIDALKAFAREDPAALELPRELRPKNAYNLLRLLRSAIDWLTTGEPHLTVTGAFRERLLAIKRGEVPLADVLAEAEAMTPQLEHARTHARVPAEADRARADALLQKSALEIARRAVTAESPRPREVLRYGEPEALGLTAHQWSVTRGVLEEEEGLRRHLVIAVSGAHAYGFPSPDSDVDVKAVHIAPAADLLGLSPRPGGRERMEVIDGVEIDFSSNELGAVLGGVLAGNGNFAERLLGARLAGWRGALDELQPIISRALSKRLYRHYHGFATSQRRAMDAGPQAGAKKVLYVLRTALTGVHVLKTGELIADLSLLASEHGFGDAHALIEAKKAGERSLLSVEETERWRARVADAFQALDQALAASTLPDAPPNVAELEAWLLEARRRTL